MFYLSRTRSGFDRLVCVVFSAILTLTIHTFNKHSETYQQAHSVLAQHVYVQPIP
jgi:hypothetical protein